MNARLLSKHDKFPFETETLYSYKMQTSGNPNALAKGYDKENILTIVLKVAKSSYQNEEIQRIIKWSREFYNSPNYYRDLAINLKTKGDFEKTIVFTHAKVKADVYSDTHLDELTITLTATQKEDKMPGVAFGRELEPTYEKAWDRVNNPPRLNIYIPPAPLPDGYAKQETREYSPFFNPLNTITYTANFYTDKELTVETTTTVLFDKFTEAKGTSATHDLKYYLNLGYRVSKNGIIHKDYSRYLGRILVKKNANDEGEESVGYLENGAIISIDPVYLCDKIGYSCRLESRADNKKYAVKHKTNTSLIELYPERYKAPDGTLLDNIAVKKLVEAVEKQISIKLEWDANKKLATITLGGVSVVSDLTTSTNGRAMIANFEMSMDVMREWGIGEFDSAGKLIGIYPHYVFKRNENGIYISDGGITFGYGHWVSPGKYNSNSDSKDLIDTYCRGASIIPSTIPVNGKTYRVPNSSSISLQLADNLLEQDLKSAETAVNSFLKNHNVKLNQNQFDALVSFTHQYGENWWTLTPEKVLPKFIREGNGVYEASEVRRIFKMHDSVPRREVEAETFINGY